MDSEKTCYICEINPTRKGARYIVCSSDECRQEHQRLKKQKKDKKKKKDKQAEKQAEKQADKQAEKQAEKQADKQADKPAEKQAEKQQPEPEPDPQPEPEPQPDPQPEPQPDPQPEPTEDPNTSEQTLEPLTLKREETTPFKKKRKKAPRPNIDYTISIDYKTLENMLKQTVKKTIEKEFIKLIEFYIPQAVKNSLHNDF